MKKITLSLMALALIGASSEMNAATVPANPDATAPASAGGKMRSERSAQLLKFLQDMPDLIGMVEGTKSNSRPIVYGSDFSRVFLPLAHSNAFFGAIGKVTDPYDKANLMDVKGKLLLLKKATKNWVDTNYMHFQPHTKEYGFEWPMEKVPALIDSSLEKINKALS